MGIVLEGSEVVILARISIDLLANSFYGIAASGLLTISDHLFSSWGWRFAGVSEGSCCWCNASFSAAFGRMTSSDVIIINKLSENLLSRRAHQHTQHTHIIDCHFAYSGLSLLHRIMR